MSSWIEILSRYTVGITPRMYPLGVDVKNPLKCVPLDIVRAVRLDEALTAEFATDAMIVPYVVPGRETYGRVNKPGLELARTKLGWRTPVCAVLFADVDNDNHRLWDGDGERLAMLAWLRSKPELRHVGIYFTDHGLRLFMLLDRAIPVDEIEPHLRGFHAWLLGLGLKADPSCKDWTRFYRAPKARRKRRSPFCPLHDFENVRPVPPPGPVGQAPRNSSKRSLPVVRDAASPFVHAMALTEPWLTHARTIADGLAAEGGNWHELFLALAGALCELGAPLELVVEMIRTISLASQADTRLDDRVAAARTTVVRHQSGQPVSGLSYLRGHWPRLALLVEQTLRSAPAPPSAADPIVLPPFPEPVAELPPAQRLHSAMVPAAYGSLVVIAECGIGKTEEAAKAAVQRSRVRSTNDPLKPGLGSHTVISVPNHDMAIQVTEAVHRHGGTARRHLSQVSLRDPNGEPICRVHEHATHVANAGLSVKYELCEGRGLTPCPYAEGCAANGGWAGDPDACIDIVVHASMPKALRLCGVNTLAVIDEPPPTLVHEHVSLGDLEHAIGELDCFTADYANAIRPLLLALRVHLLGAPDSQGRRLGELLPELEAGFCEADATFARSAVGLPPDASYRECLEAAHPDWRTHPGARITPQGVHRMRTGGERLARVCKLVDVLHRACLRDSPTLVYARERKTLALTYLNEPLAQMLRRDGANVFLDASGDVRLPEYEKLLGTPPRVLRIRAPDGAPITRTLLTLPSASRKGWLDSKGMLDVERFARVLREVMGRALTAEHAKDTLCIITMLPVRVALELAHRPHDDTARAQWTVRGWPKSAMHAAIGTLGPILARWPGKILFGHYGNIRGRNDMKDADVLVTLGDPRPNIDDALAEAEYFGLPRGEHRPHDFAAVELEQAHGRARAVRRDKPATLIHVGTVPPAGSRWGAGDFTVDDTLAKGGRPSRAAEVTADDVRGLVEAVGGGTKAAELLGLSKAAVSHFCAGRRAPSADTFAALSRAAARIAASGPPEFTKPQFDNVLN